MTTRRAFLGQTLGVGTLTIGAGSYGCLLKTQRTIAISRIKGIVRRDETIIRYGGNGDGFWATWGSDDRQLIALQDGAGWSQRAQEYDSRLITVNGGPYGATFNDLATYPELKPEGAAPRYYGFGTLAVGGHIYQYLSLLQPPPALTPTPTDPANVSRWVGAKLIYSPDNGRTWCNQDGSSPVVWESLAAQSPKSMVFFREPNEAFSLLSVLQMGKN